MTNLTWEPEWFLRDDLDVLENRGNDVPTTEQVIFTYATEYYAITVSGKGDPQKRFEAVNQWLAKVQADAWDEGFSLGFDGDTYTPNPYRQDES